MPIYEYKCNKCGAEFDVMLSFNNSDKKIECKNCKSFDVQKQISKSVNVHYKCGGFYCTDNGKRNKK